MRSQQETRSIDHVSSSPEKCKDNHVVACHNCAREVKHGALYRVVKDEDTRKTVLVMVESRNERRYSPSPVMSDHRSRSRDRGAKGTRDGAYVRSRNDRISRDRREGTSVRRSTTPRRNQRQQREREMKITPDHSPVPQLRFRHQDQPERPPQQMPSDEPAKNETPPKPLKPGLVEGNGTKKAIKDTMMDGEENQNEEPITVANLAQSIFSLFEKKYGR